MPTEKNLLDLLADQNRKLPLAEALRPKTLADFLGQTAVIGEGMPLRNLIETRQLTSLLFWGPPGVGKTTLARIIAQNSEARFVELSAVNTGLKELREAVSQAEEALKFSGQQTVIFIDEIHRYSKTQQDAILPVVENGTIVLMGATTENPSFQVIPPLLSRLLIVRLGMLTREQMLILLRRGVQYFKNLEIDAESLEFLVNYANGDGRSALNLLEIAYKCAPVKSSPAPFQEGRESTGIDRKVIKPELLEKLAQQNRLNYDQQGDAHYDHASAYQKSMRGSDPDAALYWLGKMIAAGEDPRFIARRLMVTASEDVGLADPIAFILAMQAAAAVERLGMPEGRIPLAQATIYVATAPKSNQAICAIDAVLSDILKHGKSYAVPPHLRDSHYADAKSYGHGIGYVYSHDHPEVPQTFLPPELTGTRYFQPETPDDPTSNPNL